MSNTENKSYPFMNTGGKGFRLQMANGYAVSVQWGAGNYCTKDGVREYGLGSMEPVSLYSHVREADNAEVAVFQPGGEWLRRIGWHDDVVGWVTADQVAILLGTVALFDADTTEEQARAEVRLVLGTEEDDDEEEEEEEQLDAQAQAFLAYLGEE